MANTSNFETFVTHQSEKVDIYRRKDGFSLRNIKVNDSKLVIKE